MKRFKRLGFFLPLWFVFIICSVTVRTVALFTDFRILDGYFENNLLISISNVIAMLGVIFLLSFLFASPKISVVASFDNPATYIPSGIVSASLIFLSADFFVTLSKMHGGIVNKAVLSTPVGLIMLISAILALCCVVNFVFTSFFSARKNESRSFFGILSVLFLASYAIYLYFDVKLPLNSPNKTVDQMAFLFTACFFLFETRISLGIEKWRAYVGFGLSSALLLSYSAVPTLIYYFAKGVVISDSLSGAVLALTLFIYVTSRVILVNHLNENKKSCASIAVEELARLRTEELALPDQERLYNKETSFTTIGKNYEINLHLGAKSDANRTESDDDSVETNLDTESGEENL